MPHYDKIIAVLTAWKEDVQLSNEQRMFFVEPHSTQVYTYHISAVIRIKGSNGENTDVKEKSDVLTLNGLAKEIPNLDEKIKTLKDFLTDFTTNFYNKIEKESK